MTCPHCDSKNTYSRQSKTDLGYQEYRCRAVNLPKVRQFKTGINWLFCSNYSQYVVYVYRQTYQGLNYLKHDVV